MIAIPLLSSFGNTLGIHNRKIKGAVFIPNKSNYQNLFSLESSLRQINFLDLIDWFTNEKGYQRSNHRIKKLIDLYSKSEIDVAVCYSGEDLLDWEISLGNVQKTIDNMVLLFIASRMGFS
jgi:hypothetical protein